MIDFVARRAVQTVLSLWAALTLVFVAVTVLPGDPVRGLFPDRPPPLELYAALTAQYHLDQPLPTQYVLWLGDVLTGDLGRGFPVDARGDPGGGPLVTDVVAATLPVSAVILAGALLVQTLVGVVAGVLSAGRPRAGAGVYATALLLVGTPVIVAAAALRLVVGWRWEWLPVTGASGEPDTYVLPVLALAALPTGYVALITRAELVEALRAPYVQAARGRGLGDRRVVAVHALRPSLTAVVTFLAANVGQLFVGSWWWRASSACPAWVGAHRRHRRPRPGAAARARGRRDGARHRRQRGRRRPRGRARPADPVGRCVVTS